MSDRKEVKKTTPSKPRNGTLQDALFATKVRPDFQYPEASVPIEEFDYDLRNYIQAAPYSFPAGSGYGERNARYNSRKPSAWQQAQMASRRKYRLSRTSIFLILLLIISLFTVVNEIVTDGPGIVIPAKNRVVNGVNQRLSDARDFIESLFGDFAEVTDELAKPVRADPPPKKQTKEEAKAEEERRVTTEKPRQPYTPIYTPRAERTTTSRSVADILDWPWFRPKNVEAATTGTKETAEEEPEEDKPIGAGEDPVEKKELWYEKIPFNIPGLPLVDGVIREAGKSKSVPKAGKSDNSRSSKAKPGSKSKSVRNTGAKKVEPVETSERDTPASKPAKSKSAKSKSGKSKSTKKDEAVETIEPDTRAATSVGFFDQNSEKDVFHRMINLGFQLSEGTLLSYSNITDLASKLRIAQEIFHRGERTYKKHNATLAARNAEAKRLWANAASSLTSFQFLPQMQGNDMFGSVPSRLLQAMKDFEKKGVSGAINEEVHRTLWWKYQREVDTYYRRAEDWLKSIAKPHGNVKQIGEWVELVKPILLDNHAEDQAMNKNEGGKNGDSKLAAQLKLLGEIAEKAKAADAMFSAAIEKLKRVIGSKEEYAKKFLKGKEIPIIKDITEHMDVVTLLQQETEKSLKLAKDAWKEMKSQARFKDGEHPEL